ncbi:glycine cleavage system aminomethyltransferase GcvT [Clostridium cylindrosporum]|uniref:Aminomethyltransferase n=1 Tax=Clostridium cylindrosporum DSM 605 TaxID=1121307 RepID=A0A0J8D425_CLOCY|nr:glycine cleavage system aminomethyltransferase GcvT [Clostridium cylindrosporum]KMT20930.1 aminomethyltransferase GcvT [Clostridium cylindrosporum DSM 605]
MSNLKKTPLFDAHQKVGGKIVEFAGWEMPIQYEGLVEEHTAVRTQAGIFDVSHMGEVDITGPDAQKFVDYLVTNDIAGLENTQIAYNLMCNENGGIVDDLLVYKYDENHMYLVINAANIDKDVKWIEEKAKGFDVKVENVSPEVAEIAIQGPEAQAILQKVSDVDLSTIKFFYFNDSVNVAGVKCLVSRTGYTGEDGFEVYTTNDAIEKVWNALLEAGADVLKPAGLGARDTLRFEAALPLYGNEMSDTISPLEAGLGFFVKLGKASDFIGKSVLVKQKEEGLKRKTIGFEMKERGIPRHGYDVVKDGKVIGAVATGYFSPTLQKTIGTALVEAEYAELGTEIEIQIRNKTAKAEVISKRFYTKKTKQEKK